MKLKDFEKGDEMMSVLSGTVSVIIPAYQRRVPLRRAVQSVLQQEDVRIEIIICDDGSTDGTSEDWQSDSRVHYLHLAHQGACAARNAGIAAATGEYIAFLDSDDVWLSYKLRTQLKQITESHADAVCCAFRRISSDGTVQPVSSEIPICGRIETKQLLLGNFVSTQTILGNADFIRSCLFSEGLPRLQDWDYALRLSDNGKFLFFPDVLVEVYESSDSISRKPELGLQALDRLYAIHHEAYLTSLSATLAWQLHVYHFAVQQRKSGWSSYLTPVESKRSFCQRMILLLNALCLLFRAVLHRFKYRSKDEPL